ncbi:ECF-type sigma factor [Fimbriiglobus ruber]|uniref:Extracytoplasmic sigma factor ECF n=1 Tax=Fimbriiglobus ruber TaxID=1908690 RepID=A0A225DD82_9BACT|nr:ECF-type sigma factor [Fimbriiglobus ruber]OWK37594.1 extracytoplasmic sigma factor ECF [Fimbriiglobus ruber]
MTSESTTGLFPIVYDELRRLAAANLADEPDGHTLDATALVHEVYLRMRALSSFESKAGFFRVAAEAMRHILIDHARRKRAEKRGGLGKRFAVCESDKIIVTESDTILIIDEALEKLATEDVASAEIARLRLFAGLTVDEAADAVGVSRATAYRDWAYARACLTAALAGQ